MIKSNFRILFIVKIAIICFVFTLNSFADNSSTKNNLVVIGSDTAEIKIKIFSSLTCPHCANFHINVVPKIKEKYVRSGKVQLIFIDFP